MPGQVPYDDAHKVSTVFDMEMFKNLEKGEVARVCVIDEQAYMAVRHYLKELGYYECHGDYETVLREGADPAKCVACKYAEDGREVPVSKAQRHFVSHIIRYTTNNKGELLKPITFKMMAWSFSNDKFNMLTDRQKNHGKLRGKDLIIKCTDKNWQRYDVDVAAGPALWLANDELKKRLADMWQKERHLDLDKLLCRKVDVGQMRDLVTKVIQKAPADIQKEAIAEAGSVLSESDLSGLLEGVESTPLAVQAPIQKTATGKTDMGPAVDVGVKKDELNFDDILNMK